MKKQRKLKEGEIRVISSKIVNPKDFKEWKKNKVYNKKLKIWEVVK